MSDTFRIVKRDASRTRLHVLRVAVSAKWDQIAKKHMLARRQLDGATRFCIYRYPDLFWLGSGSRYSGLLDEDI